jgi:hypothetical protein
MTRRMMLALLLTAPLLAAVPSLADRRPEYSRYAWVFEGGEGVTVTVVRVGHPDNNEALVMIEGIDHPLDGAIIKHKVAKKYGNRAVIEYSMKYDGGEWVTLAFDGHMPGRRTPYLFLPKEATFQGHADRGRPLSYNKAMSQSVDVNHFINVWMQKYKDIRR